MEVWENDKFKREHESTGQVFPRYVEFSQTPTRVWAIYIYIYITYVFYFFYKITRRKLRDSLWKRKFLNKKHTVHDGICNSDWCIMAWSFHAFHTVIETQKKCCFIIRNGRLICASVFYICNSQQPTQMHIETS